MKHVRYLAQALPPTLAACAWLLAAIALERRAPLLAYVADRRARPWEARADAVTSAGFGLAANSAG